VGVAGTAQVDEEFGDGGGNGQAGLLFQPAVLSTAVGFHKPECLRAFGSWPDCKIETRIGQAERVHVRVDAVEHVLGRVDHRIVKVA
jgi:hypothetical protein